MVNQLLCLNFVLSPIRITYGLRPVILFNARTNLCSKSDPVSSAANVITEQGIKGAALPLLAVFTECRPRWAVQFIKVY